MKRHAIIVAGGSGTRMGGQMPKQFRFLKGRMVLWWSLKAFYEADPEAKLAVVIPETFYDLWNEFCLSLPLEERIPHSIAFGGSDRSQSVRNGMLTIEDTEGVVAIHDGARPLVSRELILKAWETAEKNGSAIPVTPVTDSLRKLDADGSKSVDRSQYVAVQTPQVFRLELLRKAQESGSGRSFTDEASMVEASGQKISLIEGDPENIKITHPADLEIANVLLGKNA